MVSRFLLAVYYFVVSFPVDENRAPLLHAALAILLSSSSRAEHYKASPPSYQPPLLLSLFSFRVDEKIGNQKAGTLRTTAP
jgi:hypothetical protein